MIGFVIKKAFFDAWDNLVKLVGLNFMSLPFYGIVLLGLNLGNKGMFIPGIILLFLGVMGYIIHLGVIAYFTRDIGNSQSISFTSYFAYLKKDFKDKLFFAILWSLFFVITLFSVYYYFYDYIVDGQWGLLVPLALVFWFTLFTSISLLFYYPIKIRLEGNFKRVIKKCFILFMDNPGVSIFFFIYTFLLGIVSFFSGGLLPPGPACISCVVDSVVHMYDLKYDYLEKNPNADRKRIPWHELTYELNENIGPRSLKGMLFPWKD